MIELKPSEIFYSQFDISSRWGRSTPHKTMTIGETLDRLYEGDISVDTIPKIKVTKLPNERKWRTLDNRRLWMFHHLEGAGKCEKISCHEETYDSSSHSKKFNSSNGGTSVKIYRGADPGGKWHKRITPVVPRESETSVAAHKSDNSVTSVEDDDSSSSTESRETVTFSNTFVSNENNAEEINALTGANALSAATQIVAQASDTYVMSQASDTYVMSQVSDTYVLAPDHLEDAGKCEKISCDEKIYDRPSHSEKFNSSNDAPVTIYIRKMAASRNRFRLRTRPVKPKRRIKTFPSDRILISLYSKGLVYSAILHYSKVLRKAKHRSMLPKRRFN